MATGTKTKKAAKGGAKGKAAKTTPANNTKAKPVGRGHDLEKYQVFINWLHEEQGVEVKLTPKQVEAVRANYKHFVKSDAAKELANERQEAKDAKRAEREEAAAARKAEREERQAERQAKREEREAKAKARADKKAAANKGAKKRAATKGGKGKSAASASTPKKKSTGKAAAAKKSTKGKAGKKGTRKEPF